MGGAQCDQQDVKTDLENFSIRPARGMVEAKALDEDVYEVVQRPQVQMVKNDSPAHVIHPKP